MTGSRTTRSLPTWAYAACLAVERHRGDVERAPQVEPQLPGVGRGPQHHRLHGVEGAGLRVPGQVEVVVQRVDAGVPDPG